MKYAPIVIFCYRRKIENLLVSLLHNQEAQFSDLYIFSDGFKNEDDRDDVNAVRKSLQKISGFKTVEVIESPNNRGLASSIILGVTRVLNKHKKIIVLEDDLVVSNYFLSFMNEALNFYQNQPEIWSISGYCPSINCFRNYDQDVFLSVRSSSWGWATWVSRWNMVDWDVSDFNELKKSKKIINGFNLGGDDMYKMLELQVLGKIDSWAIRWCYSQFKNKTYSITPRFSMVENNGFGDSLGAHNSGGSNKWNVDLSARKLVVTDVAINEKLIKCFKAYHDLSLYTKIGYTLKKFGGYNSVKKALNKVFLRK